MIEVLRYLNLIKDTYNKDKFMGMVQSRKDTNDVYNIGCLGKISDYQKSKDGRILINLTGISRFKIQKEIKSKKLYRQFQVDYENFISDIDDKFIDHGKIPSLRAQQNLSKDGIIQNVLQILHASSPDRV